MPTPPRIAWADLNGATVGVWGVGVEGRATLRRLAVEGAQVVVADDDPSRSSIAPRPGEPELAVLTTEHGGLDALVRCDVVVKSPGISRYRPEVAALEEAGVPVMGGLGLWLESVLNDGTSAVATVTGTKGKSTTTAIAGHLLAALGRDAATGGNLGSPPYDPDAGGHHDLWVIEMSSFQATDLASRPPVLVVTSLHPDHLDWHGDAETYFADKLGPATLPGPGRVIANAESPLLRSHAAALGPDPTWVATTDASAGPDWSQTLGLVGPHNRTNATLARHLLAAFGIPEAEDPEALAAAATGFPSLESRLQSVGTIDGVDFVDDGLSTNVLPAIAALQAFPGRRVALLAGGHDRGIDYGPLAVALAARDAGTLLATLPDNGPRIGAALQSVPGAERRVARADFADLPEAVAAAFRWARPDGVVLLSPAAPSFGRYRDYRERSGVFREAMRNLRPGGGPEPQPGGSRT